MRNPLPWLLLSMIALPAQGQDVPVFAQTLRIHVPAGFEQVFNKAEGGRFISEYLRPGETVDAWTEMVTVTGLHPQTPPTGDNPALDFALSIKDGYQAACPDSFSAYEQKAPDVPGAVAVFAGNLNCGTLSETGQSQAMTFLVVAGREEIFTYQWAIQTQPWQGGAVYDAEIWQPRLDALSTDLHLCDVPKGQTDCAE